MGNGRGAEKSVRDTVDRGEIEALICNWLLSDLLVAHNDKCTILSFYVIKL